MISISADVLSDRIGVMSSVIFALTMITHFLFQIKSWMKQPELISPQESTRSRILILSSLAFLVIFLFLILSWNVEWWLLALGVAIGFASSFISLSSSLAFLITLLVLRPFEISVSDILVQALPRAAIVTVAFMFIVRAISERQLKIFWSKECTLLGLLAIWFLLTATQSSDPAASRFMFFETFAKGAVVFIVIMNVLRNLFDMTLFKYVLLSSSLGMTVSAILFHTVLSQSASERLSYIGLLGDPNDMTAFAIMVLPFALRPLWSRHEKWYASIFAMLYLGITCFFIYLAQSRGAILAILALFVCIAVYKLKDKRVALIFAILVGMLYFPVQSLLNRDVGELSQSGSNRMTYWKTAVNMAIRHPLTGVGFHDYPNQYDQYLTDVIHDESGKRTAHSSWLLVLAENGFIGLGLFLSLFILAGKYAYQIRKSHPEYLFSLISYGVAMSFLSHSYLLFPYLLLAFTYCSAEIILSNKRI